MDPSSDRVAVVSLGRAGLAEGIVLLAPLGAAVWSQMAVELARFATVRLVTYPARGSFAAIRCALDAIAISRQHLVVAGSITASKEFSAWLRTRPHESRIVIGDCGHAGPADLVVAAAASSAGDTVRVYLQRVVTID